MMTKFRTFTLLAILLGMTGFPSAPSLAQAVYVPSATRDLRHSDGTRLDQVINQTRLGNWHGSSLKRFLTALSQSDRREVIIRQYGTSIDFSTASSADYFARALQKIYGKSASAYQYATTQEFNAAINGWLPQWASVTHCLRLRGRSGDGATPITLTTQGAALTVYYSKESDGGSITVSINGVSQTAINCSGTQTAGVAARYVLDPSVTSTIVLTPPSSGYGYLEGYLYEAASPYAKRGIRLDNLATGGTSLAQIFAGHEMAASGIMATSQTIANTSGLTSIFAPTDSGVKPDLIIIGGPTNDAKSNSSDAAAYKTMLLQVMALADANGTDVIYLMEPANSGSYAAGAGGSTAAGAASTGTDDGTSGWGLIRTAIQQAIAQYPDAAAYADWDYALKYAAYADKFHSQTVFSDPHPHNEIQAGDAYAIGGDVLRALLSIPTPAATQPSPENSPALATALVSATEPLFAPPGTIWRDTSNTAAGILKRKIAPITPLSDPASGAKGVWEAVKETGVPAPANLGPDLTNAQYRYSGTSSSTTLIPGEPALSMTSDVYWHIPMSVLQAGKTYTFSYVAQNTNAGDAAFYELAIGAASFLQPDGTFQAAGSLAESTFTSTIPSTDPRRFVQTFTVPSSGALTALSGAGVDTSYLSLRIRGTAAGTKVAMVRLDAGASVVIAAADRFLASSSAATVASAATEPDTASLGLLPGTRWRDTGGPSSVTKRLVEPLSVLNIAAPQTPLSLWERTDATSNVNLVEMASPDIRHFSGPGSEALYVGGPGIPVNGMKITGAGGGGTTSFFQGTGGDLVASKAYTVSFLLRWDSASAVLSGVGLRVWELNGGNNHQLHLQTGFATWDASNDQVFTIANLPAKNVWRRYSLTFTSPTSGQLSGESFVHRIGFGTADASCDLYITDLKYEPGGSVTLDN